MITETREDITADGVTYKNARIYRKAVYGPDKLGVPRPGLIYRSSDFQVIKTNLQLGQNLMEYSDVESALSSKLTVRSTSALTRTQLDAMTDNIMVNCRKGSVQLNGAEEYTVNVYRHSPTNITQEQVLPDMQRFVRHWDSDRNAWGEFYPITENLHIDVKIVDGTTVYIRHGYIPEGMQLVLLRKKKRTRKRRSGGMTGSNPGWREKHLFDCRRISMFIIKE